MQLSEKLRRARKSESMLAAFGSLKYPAGLLVVGCLAVIFAFLIRIVIVTVAQRYVETKEFWPKDLKVGKHFFPAFFLLVFVILLWAGLPLTKLSIQSVLVVQKFLKFFGVLVATWNVTKLLTLFEYIIYDRLDISVADNLKQRQVRTQYQFVDKILTVLVWTIGISLALMTFEEVRRIGTSLLASAGLASVILGFAAQKSIANLIAGFQIAFTQPIRIGDRVQVEGEVGVVDEITLTYVVVAIWDQRNVVLPISYFVEKPFQNWTRKTAELLGTVVLYLDYNFPVDEIRSELKKILESDPRWDRRESNVQVTDATEKSMAVRILASAKNPSDMWDLRCAIREKLIEFVRSKYPECLPKSRVEPKDVAGNLS